MSSARFLVVRFSSLGDVVLTTPLLRVLRRAHPGADITLVTKDAYAPLFAGGELVTRVVGLAPGESVAAFARRLPARTFDRCIDLHGSLRSLALRARVRGRWSSYARRRMARAALVHLGVGAGPARPVAERYFTAVRDMGLVPDGERAAVHWSDDAQARAAAVASPGAIVLAPGAHHASKRWPLAHWRALAARLVSLDRPVVGAGTADERYVFAGIGVIDAFGQPLDVTAALLARARVVVANDSGLLHLATAAGAPVVGLYGPTVRALGFHPYQARAAVLERALPCRPCSAHGSAACPRGHQRCLGDISPDQVLHAIGAA